MAVALLGQHTFKSRMTSNDYSQMTIEQLKNLRDLVEKRFEKLRNKVFGGDNSQELLDDWNICVDTINAINQAHVIKVLGRNYN